MKAIKLEEEHIICMYILIWFPKWFWPIQCKICYIIHNAMVCTACVANRLLRYIDNYRYFWNTKSELGFIKICNSRLYFENRHLSADKGLRVHAPKTFWNFSGHWRSILVFWMRVFSFKILKYSTCLVCEASSIKTMLSSILS